MKGTVIGAALLATAAWGGALAYQTVAREHNYRLEIRRGDTAMAEQKASDAVEAYSGAIALHADSMLGYLRRGEAYFQRGDLALAARDFRQAAAIDPSAVRALEELGDVEYRRGRFAQAADSFEARLRIDERSADVAYKLALARYRSGDRRAALAAIARALRLNGELAPALYLQGVCLRETGKLQQAAASLERAVTLAPGDLAVREELADVDAALDRRASEIEQLQALAALDSSHPARHVALARAYARGGQWDLAVLTVSAAVERAPDDPLLYSTLGEIWLDRPREKNDRVFLSKAREALERIATLPTASSAALALYGRALLQDGEADAGEQALRDATHRDPVDPQALVEYAAIAERQNHLEAARSALIDYDALTWDDPGAPARDARIAALSLRLDEPRTAATWLQKAVSAAPADARWLAALANAQLRAGDRAAASATVTRGLQVSPRDAALQALANRVHAQP